MTRKASPGVGAAPEASGDEEGGERRPLVDRVLALLDVVAEAGRPLAVKDIAEKLDLPKPTAHRLVATLEERGYLIRPIDRKLVTVGPKLRTLALGALRSALVQAPAHVRLRALSMELGETCNIGVLDGGDIVYLDRVEAGNWPLRLEFGVGSRVPLHCTAMGKLFLASMTGAARQRLMENLRLPRMTEATLCDPQRFAEELDRIAAAGHALDDEEYTPGVFCCAVPIRDDEGRVVAGLAVQAPKVRLSGDNVGVRLPILHRAAADMARILGIASAADGTEAEAPVDAVDARTWRYA